MFKKLLVYNNQLFFCNKHFCAKPCSNDAGSVINFFYKKLGVTVTGTFTGLKGNILFDPGAPC
jgi:hypothetical protein